MALLPVVILLPMMMAALAVLAGRKGHALRDGLVSGTGAAVFGLCVLMTVLGGGEFTVPAVCGFGLTLKADGFRMLYACIAAFMWMMTGFFTPDYMSHGHARTRYSFFNLMTLGATLACSSPTTCTPPSFSLRLCPLPATSGWRRRKPRAP